ncbi:MAG: PilZ domain-containing protein [Desulfobulbus sp.]|nr:PilZ domain-containing protein [Desulfobulbus sp.]
MSLHVKADILENRLYLKLSGKATAEEFDKLYTDVRFLVADLSPGFGVISDLADYDFNNIKEKSYKKISNYLLTNGLGEVVQVIKGDSLLYDQAQKFSLKELGLRPIFAKTSKEAEEKLSIGAKRNGIRFYTRDIEIQYSIQGKVGTGNLKDISIGGCSVESATLPISVNEELFLKIVTSSSDSSFSANAKIIRIENDSFSARFEELDQYQKLKLWKVLISRHHS